MSSNDLYSDNQSDTGSENSWSQITSNLNEVTQMQTFSEELIPANFKEKIPKMINNIISDINADYYTTIAQYKLLNEYPQILLDKKDFNIKIDELQYLFDLKDDAWYKRKTLILSSTTIDIIKNLQTIKKAANFRFYINVKTVKDLLLLYTVGEPFFAQYDDIMKGINYRYGHLYVKLYVNMCGLYKSLYYYHIENLDETYSKYFIHLGLDSIDDEGFSIIEALLIYRFFENLSLTNRKNNLNINYSFNCGLLFIYGSDECELLKNLEFINKLNVEPFIICKELGAIGIDTGVELYNTNIYNLTSTIPITFSYIESKYKNQYYYQTLEDFMNLYNDFVCKNQNDDDI